MIDRMNAAIIVLLACMIMAIIGAYFLRDNLYPLALHNTPSYPPPEYRKHIWAVNDFTFSTNNCIGTLAPEQTCTVGVTFTPDLTGNKDVPITISNHGTTPIIIDSIAMGDNKP